MNCKETSLLLYVLEFAKTFEHRAPCDPGQALHPQTSVSIFGKTQALFSNTILIILNRGYIQVSVQILHTKIHLGYFFTRNIENNAQYKNVN